MPPEHADAAVPVTPPHVLYVRMKNPPAESPDELHVINALVAKMARIVVEPEALMPLHGINRTLSRGDVECNLRRMNFQPELHALLLESIKYRRKTLGKILVPSLYHIRSNRRKRIQQMPDRAARETVYNPNAQFLRSLRRIDNALRRTLLHPFRLSVAPNIRRQDRFVTAVNIIANRLADQMSRNRKNLQPVLLQQLTLRLAVPVVRKRLINLEVVSPASQLKTVITPGGSLLRQLRQGQIRPLSRK